MEKQKTEKKPDYRLLYAIITISITVVIVDYIVKSGVVITSSTIEKIAGKIIFLFIFGYMVRGSMSWGIKGIKRLLSKKKG